MVQVKLNELRLHRPRQWGACWLALKLWEQLELDRFWQPRLPMSRQGTKWLEVLKTQVCYQLIDPGSEWRLHRQWYEHRAMRDLLGSATRVLSDDTLYRCLDKLLAHKRAFFSFLRQRWEALFQARFDILLYDLTSTYFESDPPFAGNRQFGYSRDKRPDCVQVVIALVVTPQGFPLAYEVMPGNTSDKTTLKDFLEHIEAQYGRSDRVWVMDRGIPTEETLEQMRTAHRPPHHPAAEHIEYDGQVQESRRGRDVGDVGHPQSVRGFGHEATLDQVRRGAGLGVTTRGARPLATAHPGQACLTHLSTFGRQENRHSRATRLRLTGVPSAVSSA